jgi:amino acid transporter
MTAVLSQVYIRYTSVTLFAAYVGLLSTISYTPLKTLVYSITANSRSDFSTKQMDASTSTSNLQVYKVPVIIQAALLTIFILAISFGGARVSQLYNQLTIMTNISRSIPYLLVAMAFPIYKHKQMELQPFKVIHSKFSTYVTTALVSSSIIAAVFFSIFDKVITKDYMDALWLTLGPLTFSVMGLIIYKVIAASQK